MPDKAVSYQGFTLLEVLVALAILSATLVMAFQVTSGAIAAAKRSEAWTTASLLGEDNLRDTTDPFPEVQETTGTFPDPHADYSWKISVRQALHPDAREVYVSVSWMTDGVEETITLSGLAVR